MSVKTKDELLGAIKERIGEDNSDSALAFIEDISDTLADFESKANGDGVDWKSKYEENDREWRDKYKERFFSGEPLNSPPNEDNIDEPRKTKTFEELFD